MPPEDTTPEGGGGDTTPTQEAPLIAGKFKDEDSFRQAFTSLATHEKVNMPELAEAKFENTDRQVAVYKQLESMLGRAGQPPAHTKPDEGGKLELGQQQQAAQQQPATPLSMQELVQGIGIEQDKLNQAVMGGQGLPQDIYEAFSKATVKLPDGTERPIGKEIVDQVIGSQAQAAQMQQVIKQQAAQHVGGQDKLAALMQFGATLDPTTQQSINLELANPSTVNNGLDRLNQLYAKHVGSDNSNGIVSDTQAGTPSLADQPFKTAAEEREFRKKHGGDSKVYQSRLLKTPNDVLNTVA